MVQSLVVTDDFVVNNTSFTPDRLSVTVASNLLLFELYVKPDTVGPASLPTIPQQKNKNIRQKNVVFNYDFFFLNNLVSLKI